MFVTAINYGGIKVQNGLVLSTLLVELTKSILEDGVSELTFIIRVVEDRKMNVENVCSYYGIANTELCVFEEGSKGLPKVKDNSAVSCIELHQNTESEDLYKNIYGRQ